MLRFQNPMHLNLSAGFFVWKGIIYEALLQLCAITVLGSTIM